ncbi:hypothetical protein DKX15_15770, partial [Enterococcus faecium]
DPVPGAGGALSKVADGQYIPGIGLGEFLVDVFKPPPSDSVFSHNPDMGIGMHVHADGYPDVARAFDASTDARFDEVRQRMKAFQGRVIETVE